VVVVIGAGAPVLFVARDRGEPGRYDAARGEVEVHGAPGSEDLLNFAAVHTLLHAGTVYAVKPDEVPGGGGALAAIFWLPLPRPRK